MIVKRLSLIAMMTKCSFSIVSMCDANALLFIHLQNGAGQAAFVGHCDIVGHILAIGQIAHRQSALPKQRQ